MFTLSSSFHKWGKQKLRDGTWTSASGKDRTSCIRPPPLPLSDRATRSKPGKLSKSSPETRRAVEAMSRRQTDLEKKWPFLGQLTPTYFLPWGYLHILSMGVDLTWASRPHRGRKKPQRLWPSWGAGMTDEKPQRLGWFSPWDSGWALGKPIRGLNNLGAKSETDYPASQVSFVLFFWGPWGPKDRFHFFPLASVFLSYQSCLDFLRQVAFRRHWRPLLSESSFARTWSLPLASSDTLLPRIRGLTSMISFKVWAFISLVSFECWLSWLVDAHGTYMSVSLL